jgi:hypothetical protein
MVNKGSTALGRTLVERAEACGVQRHACSGSRLPATVVTPRTSSAGWRSASSSAWASSMLVSTSSSTGVAGIARDLKRQRPFEKAGHTVSPKILLASVEAPSNRRSSRRPHYFTGRKTRTRKRSAPAALGLRDPAESDNSNWCRASAPVSTRQARLMDEAVDSVSMRPFVCVKQPRLN